MSGTVAAHDVEILWLKHPLFAPAGEERCLDFARRYPAREEPDGVELARAGTAADSLIVLLDGTLRLFHTAPDGRQVTVKLLRAPNTAGTLELIHGISLLIGVATVDRAVVARFPRDEYLTYIQECPAACFEQVRHIAAAFLVAARNERQAFTNLSSRVASLLLSYAQFFGREEAQGLLIDHPLTQQAIAEGVGTVRRSVAGLMAQWRHEGVLTKRRGRVLLLDIDYLEDAADLGRGSLCYQMGMSLDHLEQQPAEPSAMLEVTSGQGSMVGRQALVQPEVVIGRAPPSSLLLADDQASTQHCRVFVAKTGGRIWIEDLQSENGTLVNGRPVTRAVLRGGDEIQIGGTTLVLRFGPPATTASEALSADREGAR